MIVMVSDPYEIILNHLRALRSDVSDLKSLRGEMREGFASLRAPSGGVARRQAHLERRLAALNLAMSRVETRLQISDKAGDPD